MIRRLHDKEVVSMLYGNFMSHFEELICYKVKSRINSKRGHVPLKRSPSLNFTRQIRNGYKNIVPFYKKEIKENKIELKMLHFFINTGINDNTYWNELVKCIKVYVA
jgi:arginine decarboxylase